ncbi:MAG TPA: hypothetical protein VEC37_02745, partial [Bacillota bacterium]|nr:hypothetical protein [Bacillota bacterium]
MKKRTDLKKTIQQLVITMFGITISYSATAVTAFVNIGQGPVGAFQLTTSYLTGLRMGLIAILFQAFFFMGQIVLEKKNFRPVQCLQLLVTTYGGLVLDFILYDLLGEVAVAAYPLKLLFCVLAIAVNAFGVELVLETGLIRIPLEGFVMLLAERIRITLGRLKQIFDCSLLAVTLIVTLLLGFEFTIREATVINALLFGVFLDWFKQPVRKMLRK